MRANIVISSLLAISISGAVLSAGGNKWENAEAAILRLNPSAFGALPVKVIRELEEKGCTIPQTYASKEPHNVVRGEFAKKGQQDWAVLCSRKRSTSIMIFWGGNRACASDIQLKADIGMLQGTGYGIGYSRAIERVGNDFVMSRLNANVGSTPPKITQDGIDDAFIEKASVVHYCHNGKWIELSGAD